MKIQKLVECVPNFSEGRSKKVMDEIMAEVEPFEKIRVLDIESDPDHNRFLCTLIGDPDQMLEAVFAMIKKAAQLIDMDKHKGEHPRIGAADVVPFIPVSGLSMDECVALARKLGKRVGEELKIPVYLYEAAATRPERKNLANIRKGDYEGLKKVIGKDPDRAPDFGPAKMGKAGAMVIGARKFLVAYNVNLDTKDLGVAKEIAKIIREKDGGFPAVKALGFDIKDKGNVQVSMNLCDFDQTNMDRVYQKICQEAKKRRVKVLNSEIYGMLPLDALVKLTKNVLKATDFEKSQILETRLWEFG